MIEFLRDPIWQFIGSILACIALISTILIYFLQRRHKMLQYQTAYMPLLLRLSAETMTGIKISYEEKSVENIYFVWITFMNGGNIPIIPGDYVVPVNITFDQNIQILSAEVAISEPKNPQAAVSLEKDKVILSNMLLNEYDRVTVKILVDQRSNIQIGGRIVGVKEIQEYVPPLWSLPWRHLIFSLIFIIGGLAIFIWGVLLVFWTLIKVNESMFSVLLLVTGFILPIIGSQIATRGRMRFPGPSILLYPSARNLS